MRVKFLRHCQTKVGKGNEADQIAFEEGKIVDLPEPSARHWINRGAAAEVVPERRPEKKPAE